MWQSGVIQCIRISIAFAPLGPYFFYDARYYHAHPIIPYLVIVLCTRPLTACVQSSDPSSSLESWSTLPCPRRPSFQAISHACCRPLVPLLIPSQVFLNWLEAWNTTAAATSFWYPTKASPSLNLQLYKNNKSGVCAQKSNLRISMQVGNQSPG